MKDMNGLTHSFTEWSAVLDFLLGIKHASDKKDIHITRKGGQECVMKINGVEKTGDRKIKSPGAALYDLYW